jgi:hypothetical protein
VGNIQKLGINSFRDVVKHLIELDAVETSLNLVAIAMDENGKNVLGVAINYIAGEGLEKYDYYKLYRIDIDGKTFVVVSSTIALHVQIVFNFKMSELNNGEILFIEPTNTELNITRKTLE